MWCFQFDRPKSDFLRAWCRHEVTSSMRKQLERAEAAMLEALVVHALNSSDASVVRAVTEYRAVLEWKWMMTEPKGGDDAEE